MKDGNDNKLIELLPEDTCTCELMLAQLTDLPFIARCHRCKKWRRLKPEDMPS